MESKHSASSARRHRRLVALTIGAAALLWWIPNTLGTEVYPAVSLPSFGPVPEPGDRIDYVFEVTLGSGTTTADTGDVLAGVRSSAWPNVTEALAAHRDEPEVAQWLLRRGTSVIGMCADAVSLIRVVGNERTILAVAEQECAP